MTDLGYVATGWAATWVLLGAYGWWLVQRGKRLAAQVPAEERRWSSPATRQSGGPGHFDAMDS